MFAFLVRNSLRCRVLVLAVAAIMMAVGGFLLPRMPIDVLPDLNSGVVTVLTEAPGFSTEEVENLVTVPLEAMLNGVAGVNRIRTTSGSGLSIVAADFGLDADPWRARQVVAERLQASTPILPAGLQPIMMPLVSVMGEIMLISLSGDENADPMALRDLASWVVAPRLRAIPGVSLVVPIGGLVRQLLVTVDPWAMNRLDVSSAEIEEALKRFGANSSAGFVNRNGQVFQIRTLGQPGDSDGESGGSLEQLRRVIVGVRDGVPVPLSQVAAVTWGAMPRVGDASYMARPGVILSVVKQPSADAVPLTRVVEATLDDLRGTLPPSMNHLHVLFRQADFIEVAVNNVSRSLAEAVAVVAIVLLLFLGNMRTTIISLTAIPLSMLITFVVFRCLGLSINTMTLGGLAIAIGELVDDAVVDVENILRRLRENRKRLFRRPVNDVIVDASQEVRSGIVYSTLIIILVFVPLFAIPGIEGKLFAPLGVAYIVSILASLLTSITVTPVLCSYLLPRMPQLDHGESRLVRGLKRVNFWLVTRAMDNPWRVIGGAGFAVAAALLTIPTLPRAFLPGFNETSLVVVLTTQPGISLDMSSRIGALAERMILAVPEVRAVGRRTGRSETDEHALGVNESEIEVDLAPVGTPGVRRLPWIIDDVRARLGGLPVTLEVEQPISHRLFDHILTGLAAQLVIKVFGPDINQTRILAQRVEAQLRRIDGLTDVGVERQVAVPEIRLRADGQKAAMLGVTPGGLAEEVDHLAGGATVSRIVKGLQRIDVVLRVSDENRTEAGLAGLLVETQHGHVPLSYFATVEIGSTPNQILREDGQRRIAVTANGRDGVDRVAVASAVRDMLARLTLPPGYSVRFEGTFAAQNEANLRLAGLGLVSLLLIFVVLYVRYQSVILALIVLCNVPLALVGSVIAIKLAHLELSLASMIGFVTLTGISARNGILKVSHCLNLMLREGEEFGRALVLRACQERMLPVLMTATSAGVALVPLLFDASAPGKELLHPVAVAIFGGLVSSTALDTVMTPVLIFKFGRPAAERLAAPTVVQGVPDAY
jgi:HME family heavy-metal exporter